MARVRLSPLAEQDIEAILAWTHGRIGEQVRMRYEDLLAQAILDLADDPGRSGSIERPELARGASTYRLRSRRDHVRGSSGRIRRPRHFLWYRVAADGNLEIVRVVHDSMELVSPSQRRKSNGGVLRRLPGFPAVGTRGPGGSCVRIRGMKIHATTILAVRHRGAVAMGSDGQVTLGNAVVKADAVKVRRLLDGQVLCGFAGAAADAFALLERFETKLRDYPRNMPRAATELAKEWRTDRALRRLEAMLAVADAGHTLLLSGTGDVIQPSDGILAIGSGGNFALAAARALVAHAPLGAADVVREALKIAGEICIYSNTQIVVEELACVS